MKPRAHRTLYMHTLDGNPAAFVDGHLVFSRLQIPVALTLRQIRKEQAANAAWEMSYGKQMRAMGAEPQPALPARYVTIKVPRNLLGKGTSR